MKEMVAGVTVRPSQIDGSATARETECCHTTKERQSIWRDETNGGLWKSKIDNGEYSMHRIPEIEQGHMRPLEAKI